MAELVNLQESEKNNLAIDIQENHEEIITNITSYIRETIKLVTDSEGFQGGMVSEKAKSLLEVLQFDILPVMEQVFQQTEMSISILGETLTNTDTLC